MMDKDLSHYNIDPFQKAFRPEGGTHRLALLEAVFIVFAYALLVFWSRSPWGRTLSITFVAIIFEALPFMLVGSLVGGLIEVFVSQKRIVSILPKGKNRAVFIAAGMGAVFPVCECAIVPVIRRLLSKGISPSAAIAFLLSGPIVNPIVFASTAVAYRLDWRVAIIRLGAGYLIAVLVGLGLGFFLKSEDAVLKDQGHTLANQSGADHETTLYFGNRLWIRLTDALHHAAVDFFDMGRFLIMGAFVAATIQSVVDRSILFTFAENPLLAIAVMMVLAIVLNLCSESDAFVASTFRFSVPLSGQMAFMVLGPMFDLKLLFMYLGVFGKKAIIYLVLSVLISVFVAMVLINFFLV